MKTFKSKKTTKNTKQKQKHKKLNPHKNYKIQIQAHTSTELVMFSANADGLRGKTQSVKK